MSGKTGGQAAYEAFRKAFPLEDWGPWERIGVSLNGDEQPGWEAIAAAGAASAHERAEELLREVGDLHELIAEIISKASILTAYDGSSELSELIGYLSQRAGIVPAVATSGTEHLAAEITRLAIPDEEARP